MKVLVILFEFVIGLVFILLMMFEFEGNSVDVLIFLIEIDIVVFLVIEDGVIVFENYWLIGGEDVIWLFMFVVKSFVLVLVGIVVGEGKIDSIQDLVMKYVFEFVGLVYDGVLIKDIL